ncbi:MULTISPECIES: diguanylate cyclase [unclassified Anabaena]|uniref:diguanylate cyclase n=1 Tax=unclassified Anabaena TaxID=2619674 RepID=UPI001445A98C|nr:MULTISPECIES: diguanylate cyclase [unclassified Anabaena]MTJ10595.1 diguanylate cyclase [Anabaena sp. UHCC 0204]MTJ54183.1 diguanylate cyclase [Anabaena sp. UHCC 0253]
MEKVTFNPRDCTILIVDDLIQNIQVLGRTLETQGYSITYAMSGKEALQRLQAIQPDLILLDLLMPDMSGLEVCEQIKKNPAYYHIPILFLTASHEEEHLIEAFEKGAADYVTKPFRATELLARVQTHIQLKLQTRQLQQSENKLNTIVTYIKDGILIINESGVVKFANPAAAQMFDKQLSDLIDHELGLPIVVEKVAEIDILRSNGILGRAEITVADAEWLEQKVSIVAMRDVSERNQIEKKLRIALNKQKVLSQKLKKIANTDVLTGIANRRNILAILKKELQRTQRYHQNFSLLLIDIDHFKSINDTYGHPIGDQVLQEISQFLINYLRNADTVGRLGGEEFLVILPATKLQEAIEIAERLCHQIRNLDIEMIDQTARITVSIGVTTYQDHDINDTTMLKRVDNALYKAKESGRDRVIAISD